MEGGYIALHRKLLEWEWYDDIFVCRVFIHCLLKANHKDKMWRGILVRRGQFVSSTGKLADQTGLSVQNIKTVVKKLKSTNELTSEGSSQHTVYTVINYDYYQSPNQRTNQQSTGEANNEQPTANHQLTTNNNDNNDKKIKPSSSSKKFSDDHLAFAKGMFGLIKKVAHKVKEPNLESWANEIRLMNENDHHDLSEMADVFRFANRDAFWSTNILSPKSFRAKYAELHAKMIKSGCGNQPAANQSNIETLQRFINDQPGEAHG